MNRLSSGRLDAVVTGLAQAFPGPGGAVAVLHEGQVVVRHTWGFANCEARIAFTPATLFRICSISKQFTCALLRDLFPDPAELDADVRRQLPLLGGDVPTMAQLAHNQSGLRDYWALAMLHGAPAESPFSEADGDALIRATRSLQFAPGTRYSYANNNFRIISNVLQERTGRSYAELLRTRMFEPLGMSSAFVAADTRAMPDGTEGYEGTVAAGFRAAENRIVWTGDAGIGASLDDMIAWEQHIDASRDTPDSHYRRIAVPVTFADGTPASYGYGLTRARRAGRAYLGHEGALRGWRASRGYFPAERLSVVVLMNHLGASHAALDAIAAAAFGAAPPADKGVPGMPDWLGAYLEPETGIVVRTSAGAPGHVALQFGTTAESLAIDGDGAADASGTRLRPVADGLLLERPFDNFSSLLQPLAAAQTGIDLAGRYACAELGTELTIQNAGGALYGACSGSLGRGRMELLAPVGGDVWALPCPRALDHFAPGDWTLVPRRNAAGRVVGLGTGCWLARGLAYDRVD